MKGFIEVIAGRRHLINVRHIEEVIEGGDGSCTIYIAFNPPNTYEQDNLEVNQSYDEIVALIKEAMT